MELGGRTVRVPWGAAGATVQGHQLGDGPGAGMVAPTRDAARALVPGGVEPGGGGVAVETLSRSMRRIPASRACVVHTALVRVRSDRGPDQGRPAERE